MILNTTLFKWDPLITWWEIRGHNGAPWWRNDELEPLITWREIRGHHFDCMMRKLGALDGVMENLGPLNFALWWPNGKLETLNKAMGKLLGAKWPDEENGQLDFRWRNRTLIWGPFDDTMGKLETLAMMKLGPFDAMIVKLGALDH